MKIKPWYYVFGASLILLLSSNVRAEHRYWLPGIESLTADKLSTQPHTPLNTQPPHPELARWQAFWQSQLPSEFWGQEARQLIVKYRRNAPRASRTLTLLYVAMHDAAQHAAYTKLGKEAQTAASHAAASAMLAHLFPLETRGRIEAQGASALAALASLSPSQAGNITSGAAIGQKVAQQAILSALHDGGDDIWDARSKPKLTTAMWQPTPPLDSAHPQEPLAGSWQTWVITDGSQIQPARPNLLEPKVILDAAKTVLNVSRNLTDAQKKIADYWHLDQGSVTPPGLWNQKAQALAEQYQLTEKARLDMLAALNVAMLDATIACWHTKFHWWVQRPITVIRENIDPSFMPYLVTPPHPSYVSGHATVSGAAAEVLTSVFPEDAELINSWATEAAMSRLYGGIHYPADNEDGLKLGRRIGKMVVSKALSSNQ